MMSVKRWFGVVLISTAMLAGCSISDPDPAPTDAVVVVDPAAQVAAVPEVVPTEGAASDVNVAGNGRAPVIPQSVLDQQIVVEGAGAASQPFAVNGNNPARFTPEQAVAIAANEAAHPSGIDWSGLCEGFAGSYVFGWASSGWPSARDAYFGTPHRRQMKTTTDARVGSMLKWPNPPYGHSVLYMGNGRVASQDFVRPGKVDIVSLRQISDAWFGGVLPSTFDPVEFPVGYGSNGLRAPSVPKPAPVTIYRWPLVGPVSDKRVSVLKGKLGWANRYPYFGKPFIHRIVIWQRHHPAFGPANGHVRSAMWTKITGLPA